RFRGAEPDVFRQLQAETPAEGRLPLATNFRSQPAVIDFVNTLFAPVFGEAYRPLRAARPQATPGPAVEFLWAPVAKGAKAEAKRRAEARSIARRLRTLIDSAAPIVAEPDDATSGGWAARPARPGDIAILFRALSDVQHYEEALRDEGIEYHLVGGRAFYSQQEVYDVANLLTAVASGCDEIALAGVLRSPFFSLHDETLLWVAKASGRVSTAGSLPGGLAAGFAMRHAPPELSGSEAAKLQFARQTLRRLRGQKGRSRVAELLIDAVRRTAYDAVLLSEFLGERKLANLNKLIDQARAFDAYRPGDLDGFVRQLTEFIAREPKEALAATRGREASEVRLMTVHGAKGLEFPVVVLADLDRTARPDTNPVAYSPAMGPLVRPTQGAEKSALGLEIHRAIEGEEEQRELDRLFYVGCTRAADYLMLSAAYTPPAPPAGPLMKTLAKYFDLAAGEPVGCVAGNSPARPVHVEPVDTKPGSSAATARGPSRHKLLEEAYATPAAPSLPREALPVAFDPAAVRRFSVSRLTGQLQHPTRRPEAQALQAALNPPSGAADRWDGDGWDGDGWNGDESGGGSSDGVDAQGLGSLVHAVLERMTNAGDDPLRAWCEALAPQHVRRNPGRAAEIALAMLRRFQASPRYAALKQAKHVRREVEFLLPWPPGAAGIDSDAGRGATADADGPMVQGYIDCLSEDASGELTVIDYKTNHVDAAAVPKEAEKYHLQMHVYAMAVQHATGRPPAHLCLHFLHPGVEVRLDWGKREHAQAVRLVDQAMAAVRAEAAGRHAAFFRGLYG
ncbi:MAG: 3'-5' exonuclease, partial [Planctomycetota bacterium]